MALYKQKGKRLRISIDMPFPENAPKIPKKPKNIVEFAMKVKDFLTANPSHTHTSAASEFKVSRARISQLMKILNTLPPDIIIQLKNCENNQILRRFSGKRLLKIASLSSNNRITDAINSLKSS